ncbi:MAG TPA: ABC transporter permease [Pyrinomonadaceae bacterium]|nr:ABC transporter permease [Pyrinomonadaceae bacterium]
MIQGVLMIAVVSAASFALLSSAGGDAFSRLRENPQVSQETIDRLRAVYGLDRPLPERYAGWLGSALTGDLGESLYFRLPVAGLVAQRLGNTLMLAALALAMALVVAVSLSYLSVRYRIPGLGAAIEGSILFTASVPRIVLALVGLLIIAAAPAEGRTWLTSLIAAAALGSPLVAVFLAQMSRGLAEAMGEDFVRLARAKGLSETRIILRHAWRAAVNPVITLFGLSIGALVGGSVIVETILGWPGIGALTVTAVQNRDVPLVMGVVLITAVAVWLGNTIAEMLQVVNDKRLRNAENI